MLAIVWLPGGETNLVYNLNTYLLLFSLLSFGFLSFRLLVKLDFGS